MKSILETLRLIFPLIVADNIFFYFVREHQKNINTLIKSNISISRILNIKKSSPADWLIQFENTYYKNSIYTSKNIDLFILQRKKILIDNHLFIKKWRERQRERKKVINNFNNVNLNKFKYLQF